MEPRESFVFYRSFFDAVKNLNKTDKIAVWMALCSYALDGVEPELAGVPAAIFALMRPNVDANHRRYENGRKGGRPKTREKPNRNLVETKTEPNVDVNVDVNEEKREKRKPARFSPPSLAEVKDYCRSRGSGVDPQTFVDFYAAKGWMVGKSPMKDWKAALRTWERREGGSPPKQSCTPRSYHTEVIEGEEVVVYDSGHPGG